VAPAGVGGGAPPAKVEMLYCWANAREWPDRSKQTAIGRSGFSKALG
jgi:hypothetical protein